MQITFNANDYAIKSTKLIKRNNSVSKMPTEKTDNSMNSVDFKGLNNIALINKAEIGFTGKDIGNSEKSVKEIQEIVSRSEVLVKSMKLEEEKAKEFVRQTLAKFADLTKEEKANQIISVPKDDDAFDRYKFDEDGNLRCIQKDYRELPNGIQTASEIINLDEQGEISSIEQKYTHIDNWVETVEKGLYWDDISVKSCYVKYPNGNKTADKEIKIYPNYDCIKIYINFKLLPNGEREFAQCYTLLDHGNISIDEGTVKNESNI